MPVNFTSAPRKLKEQIPPEDIFRHTEVTGNSQLDLPEAKHTGSNRLTENCLCE